MNSSFEQTGGWTISTERLTIRPALATDDDIDLLYRLWTNPDVMKFVGFPKGLRIDHDKLKAQLESYGPDEYDRVLLASLSEDGSIIGECKLVAPDKNKIAKTDVKLFPEFQGKSYGREIKKALVDYLFENTDCIGVSADPNQNNIASIKMQEAVGGRRVNEGVYRFPESMRDYTIDVPTYEYVVDRQTWEKRKATGR